MSPDTNLDVIAESSKGSAMGSFLALMRKSMLLKMRGKCVSIVEIMVPVVFTIGIWGIYMASTAELIPGRNFVEANATLQMSTPEKMLGFVMCYDKDPIPGLFPCSAMNNWPDGSGAMVNVKNSKTWTCYDSRRVPVKGLCSPLSFPMLLFAFLDFYKARYIPTFDEIVLMKWVSEAKMVRQQRTAFQTPFNALITGQKLMLIDTNSTRAFASHMGQVTSFFNLTLDRFYGSVGEAEAECIRESVAGDTWSIIQMDSNWNKHTTTIAQNRSGMPATDSVQQEFGTQGTGNYQSRVFYVNGHLTLQNYMDRFYMTHVLGVAVPPPVSYVPMPYNEFEDNDFYTGAGRDSPFLFTLAFLFTVSQLTKRIVEEKENRVREAMMIMGLGSGSFYMSWLCTYAIQNFLTSLLIALISFATFLHRSEFFIVLLHFWLFGLSIIALSGLLSTIFSKSRLAALLAPVLYFMISVPAFALPSNTPAETLKWLSLLSPTAFGVGLKLIFSYESTGGYIWPQMAAEIDDPNLAFCWMMLVIDTVLYTLLMLYLDAVFPSEWGTRAHPLFCFIEPVRWWQRRNAGASSESLADGRDANGVFEGTDRSDQPSIRLTGLRKEFEVEGKPFVAVKDMTFDMYEGEVTVLLGHNGAGKTTCMNVMTGMLAADGGDCTIYGHSVTHDLAAVRREISLCPQHNILFEDMTCSEHLEFFAALKGQNAAERRASALAMLEAVDLLDKADVFAENLSGGMKRKLSVAMAFVGGNKMVFLDEPTAGMDVAARRHTWDLIKKMSADHTILLTTHYMDEADLLGSSIAIMSAGHLKCSGSPMFLKSRLGVGYTLTVACTSAAEADGVVALVKGAIEEGEVLTQGGGELTFRLPSASVAGFPAMLAALEECAQVRGHGLSVTTLEEVFLKIANDDHAGEEGKDDEAALQMEQSNHGALWSSEELAVRNTGIMAQFMPLVVKRFHYQKRDTRTLVFQIIVPAICIFFAMLIADIQFSDAPRVALNGGPYFGAETVIANCPASYLKFPPKQTAVTSLLPPAGESHLTYHAASNLSLHLQLTEQRTAKRRLTSVACYDGTMVPGPGAVLFANESWTFGAATAMADFNSMHAQATANRAIDWDCGVDLLPIGPFGKAYIGAINSFIFAMFVMIPFTFVPSTFVTFVVREREFHAKHLQLISGMNFVLYWFSNFLFDVLAFTITTSMTIIIFLIFNREEFVGTWELFGATFTLFMMMGITSVASAYCVSFLFENHATAQNVTMMVNFIVGFLCVIVVYFLSFIESTKEYGKALKFVFRVLPAFCLGDGIINLASISIIKVFTGEQQNPFDLEVIGYDIIYLAVELPIFLAIVFIVDHPSRQLRQQQLFSQMDEPAEFIEDEDEDVMIERGIVEGGSQDVDNVVTVKNLRKSDPASGKMTEDKLAVRNLTFGVRRGEVFGFLGTNGAGKTTTMSVLCGEILPTRGQITVAGHDVVADAAMARRVVGYCPQFEALHDLLTPEEHLRLYAGLRGLTGAATDHAVQQLLLLCGLEEHRGKVAAMLSGGNKRKLSVAIALSGGPDGGVHDEPSAGMDPMARRGLWNVIERVATQCSVILTTHHLEEVEVLATRMAIMVDGEMKCVGTLPHLKQKFGSGFEMQIRVGHAEDEGPLEEFIRQSLPHATLQESRNLKMTYALPAETKLSETFATVEANKVALNVTDYAIAQASVEQVFLRIEAAAEAKAMDASPQQADKLSAI
jgi:ABC-type multidrug transport system ATPase subunit